MILDMAGFVDDTFQSAIATRIPQSGSYVNGKWQATAGSQEQHSVTIQPVSEREIQNLGKGGERLVDVRRIYVNDGTLASIGPSDIWKFDAGQGLKQWKAIKLDCRPWRNYCKVIVSRIDDQ